MQLIPDPEVTPTVPLWPDAGQAVGLGRGATYAAAARGDIPTVATGGRKRLVPTAALRRMLALDPPGVQREEASTRRANGRRIQAYDPDRVVDELGRASPDDQ